VTGDAGVGASGTVGVELPGDAGSVGAARAFVRDTLARWGLDELAETTTLLTSELATNVVLHARTPYVVEVQRADDAVRVTVYDDSAARPHRRRNALDAGTGRGLGLVEALAASWGAAAPREGRSKGVWFEVPLDPQELRGSAEGALYGENWLAMVEDL